MDPLLIDPGWLTILKVYGYPTVVSGFLAIALFRVSAAAKADRAECAKEYRTLRNYTDRSLENIRHTHNTERMEWLNSIGDLTRALNDLLAEIKDARVVEERSAADIIEHINKMIDKRGV